MTGTLVALLLIGAVLAVAYSRFVRGRGPGRDQVDTFAAARAVTNRWSQDPTTTPQPLRDFLGAERRRAEKDPARREEDS